MLAGRPAALKQSSYQAIDCICRWGFVTKQKSTPIHGIIADKIVLRKVCMDMPDASSGNNTVVMVILVVVEWVFRANGSFSGGIFTLRNRKAVR